MAYRVDINGEVRELDVPGEMPLLWALRNELGMVGTKFGCGVALCGACTVHVDGVAARSCSTPVSALAVRLGSREYADFIRSPAASVSGCRRRLSRNADARFPETPPPAIVI